MRARSFVPAGVAGVQAVEAAGVCIATVLSGIDTASGKSYQVSSGIALTVIGAGVAVALAIVAVGLARLRKWSWTPAVLTQVFTFIVGIYLLQGNRYDWGGAAVVLAIGAAVALLLPRSLARYGRGPTEPPATSNGGQPAPGKRSQPATGKGSRKGG